MLKNKLTALLFIIVTIGLLAGMFTYKDNSPVRDFLNEYRNTVTEGTPVFERITGAIAAADTIMIRDTYRRSDFNELFGFVQKSLGKKILQDPEYGQIYKTTDNQIIFSVKERDVDPAIRRIAELKKELDKAGIPLLYVQAPFKVSGDVQTLPANITDYADKNADRFLDGLTENGIKYLDLRPLLRDGSKRQNELFFDTDHHWRIETAFDATWFIGRLLNKEYGFSIDKKIMNLESYHAKTYKNFFQGSMGRRVGILYGGVDDFTLITPAFSTNLTVERHDKSYDEVITGPFEASVLVKNNLDEDLPIDTNRYAVYRGDNAELVFKNNLEASNSVILIKDSFGLPVYSFLAPAIKETRALDMRYFDENVVDYAKGNNPDIVIIMYNADSFNDEMFDFKLDQREKKD
ncbi:MAG: hypothetical protein JJE49_07150 [Peptostreptococcaceae bacterium]|nr:hypothetical protein [Peptostreptococcaceae bacterium]